MSRSESSEGSDEISTHSSISSDPITKSETEAIKGDSLEIHYEAEEALKSIQEVDSIEASSRSEPPSQEASNSAPVGNAEDGTVKQEVPVSAENPSPEMVSYTTPGEQEGGEEAKKDEVKSSIQEEAKTSSQELDALREEYQQRVEAAERKVYALTKERDMLRRDQSRKSDSSLLLKEKDEIIKQVMAEGEELSKKQAVQEGTMRKLRAQIRELEEEKQRLNSKLQVEEGKAESIRKDKAITEAALQEAVEKGQVELACLREYYTTALNEGQVELASLREYYTTALNEAKDEARADSEAKADLERCFQESVDRGTALLQTVDDLGIALSQARELALRLLQEERPRRDVLQRANAERADYEKRLRVLGLSELDISELDKSGISAHTAECSSSHKSQKRLPSVSSAGSVEENNLVTRASIDSDGTPMPRSSFRDRPPPLYASLQQLEAEVRQKEGALDFCNQRLVALESTRDEYVVELVDVRVQCGVLRRKLGFLPVLRAELNSALQVIDERDKEVEELKADLADAKQVYKEQITMMAGEIERLSPTITNR